ncbi:MAG: protein-disulfide reductase DsbD [Proteobacteria bacterium]|nr:protein-disulfide reductase DsbD [Pseudomonadota bacterium]NOG60507.1 protein-disulfide reductase DsbD [Pseudomonadota bacterium]
MNVARSIFFLSFLFFSFLANAGELGNKLSDLFSFKSSTIENEILDPDVAFRVIADINADKQLVLNWEIKPGYYLYKNKFSTDSANPNLTLGRFEFPKGKSKQDPAFGLVEVYYGENNVSIPFQLTDAILKEFDLNVAYQGCKEDSVCYPPIKKTLTVSVPANFESLPVEIIPGQTSSQTRSVSEQDEITQELKDKSLFLNILSFFGFGFLLALTPCVFPMIPILSGILVGEGQHITRTRAFMLSVSYVLAMALTYSILGIIAGLFSLNLQAASQNAWVLSFFSGVFVLLALSMFGFYELHLPASWQSRLSSNHNESHHGTYKGAFVMGVLSAIIVGPCVAPPLAGALLYISQTGDALLGGFALFAMGLGFGIPLLIVGATSGELLPRAGLWMDNIKHVFGIIMLGVAIWFLERILPASIILILWACLFVTAAIFMGALDKIEPVTTNWQRLWKGLGIVALVYGITLVVASTHGAGTVLKPFNKQGSVTSTETLPFKMISNLDELESELSQAKSEGKNVMLDFYADWCVVCHEMEAYTFSDPAVQNTLQPVTLLKIDVTKNSDEDKAFLKHFELFGPPAVLFFNKDAVEIKSHRLVGFVKADEFVEHVMQAVSL